MKLSDISQGRDNNFNLIRIIAALAVLITHSFALAVGTGAAEPFRDSLGMTMGSMAVDVFFVTSGFLVTASLLARQSVIEFLWGRVLRIFPALWLMLCVTVMGLGVLVTSRPLLAYLADVQTYRYVLKCATLITGVTYNLPGVFAGNPFKDAVNGSLWSLPYEIRMCAVLVIVWAAVRLIPRVSVRIFSSAVVAVAVVAGVVVVVRCLYRYSDDLFAHLLFMFFSGAALYVLRERISLSRSYLGLCLLALLSSSMISAHVFFVVYVLTIAYIVISLAYVPSGLIRAYNRVGDYSYGVYLYAFPVQQSVVALIPGISVLSLFLISVSVTCSFAAVSWHLLERRVLRCKDSCTAFSRRVFAYGRYVRLDSCVR